VRRLEDRKRQGSGVRGQEKTGDWRQGKPRAEAGGRE